MLKDYRTGVLERIGLKAPETRAAMSVASLRIYHNPGCSKSRSACALIAEKGRL